MARVRGASLVAGLLAGVNSLERSNAEKRKRTLEDALLERGTKRDDAKEARDVARHDREMREGGYVTHDEAGPGGRYKVEGRQLETMLGALSPSGVAPMGMKLDDIVTPERYGANVGGYQYDKQSDAAKLRRARIADLEHDAGEPYRTPTSPRPTRDAQPSFSERNTREIQDRINELTREGVPLSEANRRARLEAGGAAPKLDDVVGGRDQGGVDRRKKITETRAALTETNRQLRDARKALPRFATSADSTRAMPEIDRLVQRRDSIQGEYDRQSVALPTGGTPARGRTVGADSTGAQRLMDRARQAYQQMIDSGVDSATARRRYNAVIERIKQRSQQ